MEQLRTHGVGRLSGFIRLQCGKSSHRFPILKRTTIVGAQNLPRFQSPIAVSCETLGAAGPEEQGGETTYKN